MVLQAPAKSALKIQMSGSVNLAKIIAENIFYDEPKRDNEIKKDFSDEILLHQRAGRRIK